MRHNYSRAGPSLRLRPAGDEDAECIVRLRAARGEYLHAGAQNTAEQLQWLAEYYNRPGEYYFTAERLRDKRREGFVCIYNIKDRRAEWGRWVMREDSSAAAECVWLMYAAAFGQLQLDAVFSVTAAENKQVVSFHESCGAAVTETRKNFFTLNGKPRDAVVHEITAETWKTAAPRLRRLIERRAGRAE
ncbi:MAG: GNAT family N-acetyltransferase [Gammaproteobacteria bacterium]